jgi:hypothetical protein
MTTTARSRSAFRLAWPTKAVKYFDALPPFNTELI